ncbi:hypothetical protein [Acidisoma cladoniae]|uniref:hypothetical protein n=1 Tax=Acidisoma cladoniae TaxID=3040935 RepID=UPI00254DD383|nr:hypothetical protein [Acidisoma sp. PAMC 29798]
MLVVLVLALLLATFALAQVTRADTIADGRVEVHSPTKHPKSRYGHETAICENGGHSYSGGQS